MANWFDKILPSFIKKDTTKKSSVPEGLWQTCSGCNGVLYVPELEASLYVVQNVIITLGLVQEKGWICSWIQKIK